MLYSRLNPGGRSANSLTADSPQGSPRSLIDLSDADVPAKPCVSAPPKTSLQKTTNPDVTPFDNLDQQQHTPQTVAAGTSMAADPFDELAASIRPNGRLHSLPHIANDSEIGPLGLDPLAELWPSGASFDQGKPSQPNSKQGQGNNSVGSGSHASISHGQGHSTTSNHDPVDLDMLLGLTQPTTNSDHNNNSGSHAAAVSNKPGTAGTPRHHLHSCSTGDLLGLHEDHFNPFENVPGIRTNGTSSVPGAAMPGNSPKHSGRASSLPPSRTHSPGMGDSSQQSASTCADGQEQGQGAGEQRELFIYALPLSRDKLVFLPVAGWQEEPKPAPTGVAGSLQAGISKLQENVSNMWSNMGAKDPGTLQHKIYQHGQAVLENMSAEERLMRYIPKAATKVIVHHPACLDPGEVQDQLQKMTANFMAKATGKAAAAGLLLPVAVGIEIIAVPGTGWYALYQLYKASVSAKGGSRLAQYLNHARNVRVCYAGMEKLDKYVERSKLSPDGLLTQDDVDDLCHELEEPALQHPLSELRNRYLKRIQKKTGDYALLPASEVDDDSHAEGKKDSEQGKKKTSRLAFWK